MSTGQTGPMILAIGSRDDFLHVYQDDRELLSDHDIGAGVGEISGPLEFFNSDGYRLAGVYDQRWNLLRLVPTADPPKLPAVQKRVRLTIDHVRSFIEDHAEECALYGMTVQEALVELPRLSASADLREYLQTFFAHPASGGTGASGDVDHDRPGWHNAVVHKAWGR